MGPLPSYDAEQLVELLRILPDVDAVELKLTVPDMDQRPVIRALGIDSLDAKVRQVAFVDSPGLRLSEAGLVLRARRTQHKQGDVTVKLRPMQPEDAPAELRGLPGFKVEVDASPAGYTCSCSLSTEHADRKVREVMSGARALADLLSDDQRAMMAMRVPEALDLVDLTVLGPVHLLKCKFAAQGLPRQMVAELWFLPDGERILELSTKASPSDAFQAAAETKVFLAGRGVDLGAPQETKTRSTLAALVATLEKETQ